MLSMKRHMEYLPPRNTLRRSTTIRCFFGYFTHRICSWVFLWLKALLQLSLLLEMNARYGFYLQGTVVPAAVTAAYVHFCQYCIISINLHIGTKAYIIIQCSIRRISISNIDGERRSPGSIQLWYCAIRDLWFPRAVLSWFVDCWSVACFGRIQWVRIPSFLFGDNKTWNAVTGQLSVQACVAG